MQQGKTFKVIVVGDINTGKTSMTRRFVDNLFNYNYKETIGIEQSSKVLELPYAKEGKITLDIWDISGQESSKSNYKNVDGALILFDLTNRDSFESISRRWIPEIREIIKCNNNKLIPVILLASKYDLVEKDGVSYVNEKEVDDLCNEHQFIAWYKISSKCTLKGESSNIEEAMMRLIPEMKENDKIYTQPMDLDKQCCIIY